MNKVSYNAQIKLIIIILAIFIAHNAYSATSTESEIGRLLLEKGYKAISVKTVKIGDTVLSVHQNLFTKKYYNTYTRPVLVKIKAKCITAGNIYENNFKLKQEKNEWGEWQLDKVNAAINIDFPKCDTQEEVKKRIAAERSQAKRFISYANGTVLDKNTGLMWASKDNGEDITGKNAIKYCEGYRGGGYTDWRMPTSDELSELYDENIRQPGRCRSGLGSVYDIHIATKLIDITGYAVWFSEGSYIFDFNDRRVYECFAFSCSPKCKRVLPVRSVKQNSVNKEQQAEHNSIIGNFNGCKNYSDGTTECEITVNGKTFTILDLASATIFKKVERKEWIGKKVKVTGSIEQNSNYIKAEAIELVE